MQPCYTPLAIAIAEIAVVESQARVQFVRVLIEVINPCGVERRSSTFNAMNVVALVEQ